MLVFYRTECILVVILKCHLWRCVVFYPQLGRRHLLSLGEASQVCLGPSRWCQRLL